MDDVTIDKEVERTFRAFRLLGFAFLVLGGLMFVFVLAEAMDPAASIRVNGVETYDRATKIGVAAFTAVFPVIGAILAFVPKRLALPFFRYQFRRVAEIMRTLKLK